MSSPCRDPNSGWTGLALVLAVVALAACDEKKPAYSSAPPAESSPVNVAVTTLFPGGGAMPAEDPRARIYENNPQQIAEGRRLFDWYNCAGCHFHGAGGIGPAFMDPQWRYGGRLDQIYASIYQGRPNGMPSWARKIPDAQIWQIAAYVRSLSAPSAAKGGTGAAASTTPTPAPAPQGVPPPPQGAAPGVQSPPR